jgi:hypothetical protein
MLNWMYFLEVALLNVKKGRIFMISLHQVGQLTVSPPQLGY